MENHRILLVNDMPGYGKVALAAMIPVLSHMGFDLYNLPTALVSNTLDYGKFDILDTTEYMGNTIRIWEELGFDFDCICTGFIVSQQQAKLIAEYCSMQKSRKGAKIITDPIMGDNGRLYNGVSVQTIEAMKQLCRTADVIMPNLTEAALLAGMDAGRADWTESELRDMIIRLRSQGAGSVVITSAQIEGRTVIYGYSQENGQYFQVPVDSIPVRFPGTGDLFSAVLTGQLLRGRTLEESAARAAGAVRTLIECSQESGDHYKGIFVERYLEELEL